MLTVRKFLSIFTVAIAVFAFSTFATAQNRTNNEQVSPTEKKEEKVGRRGMRGEHGKRGMSDGRGMMRGLSGLDLTDTQKQQIKSLHESNKAAHEAQREEMRSLMMKKRDGSLTEADQTRFQQLREQAKASREQIHNSVLALLTPEQVQKLEAQKAEHKKRMEERKERRQERRQNFLQQDN